MATRGYSRGEAVEPRGQPVATVAYPDGLTGLPGPITGLPAGLLRACWAAGWARGHSASFALWFMWPKPMGNLWATRVSFAALAGGRTVTG